MLLNANETTQRNELSHLYDIPDVHAFVSTYVYMLSMQSGLVDTLLHYIATNPQIQKNERRQQKKRAGNRVSQTAGLS